MEKYLQPIPLKAGDRVCIADPANAFTDEAVETTTAFFRERGMEPVLSEDMALHRGSARERAERLNRVFRDPANRLIYCVWGGYGSMELLPYLDYEALRENRPLFAGISDITALHLAIGKKTGLMTLHAPSLASKARPMTAEAKEHMMEFFTAPAEPREFRNLNGEPFETFRGEDCKGILTGGNLTLVSRLMGTPYEVETEGRILFLEEVGEPPYRVRGMLMQLLLAGKLEKAAGIVIGGLTGCDSKDRPGTGMAAVRAVLEQISVPCIMNVRAGHLADSMTLPLGAPVQIRDGRMFCG